MGSWLPIALYVLFVLVTIIWTTKHFKSDQDYFLAGRRIHPLLAFVSVIATESSVATVLIFPQAGISSGFALIWLCAGFIVGRVLVAWFYLDSIYHISSLSIYANISSQRGMARRSLSLIYLAAKFISSGVRFFMGGVALFQLFGDMGLGLSPWQGTVLWILLLALMAGIYSLSGGLKAVIITDQFQGYVILATGLIILGYLLHSTTLNSITIYSSDLIRTNFKWHDALYSPVLFLGALVLSIGSHGCDQDMLQRILATSSLRQARRALAWSGVGASIVILIYLGIGFLLSDYHAVDNQIYPLIDFIKTTNNEWLSGLFAVLLIAAAMSTLDSALHSTGAIWQNIMPVGRQGRFYSLLSLCMLLAFAIGFSLVGNRNFLKLAMGSMNYVNGALIAIVTLFVIYQKRVSTSTIWVAMITGFGSTLLCNTIPLGQDPQSGKTLYLGWTYITLLSAGLAIVAAWISMRLTGLTKSPAIPQGPQT